MNHEPEAYVGELKKLREENEKMKGVINQMLIDNHHKFCNCEHLQKHIAHAYNNLMGKKE